MHSMTLEQFRTTHQAGGFLAAQLQANGSGFFIVADSRTGGRVVLVRHSDRKPRVFVEPGTAIRLLRDVGFGSVSVDMVAWQPSQKSAAV